MTVGELIELLKKHPAETRVIINGYEGGYNDADGIAVKKILVDYHKSRFMGRHDDAADWPRHYVESYAGAVEDAVHIFGENKFDEDNDGENDDG